MFYGWTVGVRSEKQPKFLTSLCLSVCVNKTKQLKVLENNKIHTIFFPLFFCSPQNYDFLLTLSFIGTIFFMSVYFGNGMTLYCMSHCNHCMYASFHVFCEIKFSLQAKLKTLLYPLIFTCVIVSFDIYLRKWLKVIG